MKWLKGFVHNCIVHPLMPFLPETVAVKLHDRNGDWAFGVQDYTDQTPDILADMIMQDGFHVRAKNEDYIVLDKEDAGFIHSITILRGGKSTLGHSHLNPGTYYFCDGISSDGLEMYLDNVKVDILKDRVRIPPNVHHRVVNTSQHARLFKCRFPKVA